MKVVKMISIDVELANLLKNEDNASGLINELVRQHYAADTVEKLPLDKLKELKALEIKAQEILPDATIRLR